MFNKTIERWKELRDDCDKLFIKMSVKDTIIHMIKETIIDKWESFIVNRYGRESHFLKRILKKDLEEFHYQLSYSGLIHLYYDSKNDSKEQILNKLLIVTKLLNDYKELLMYTDGVLKTKGKTEQYRNASWRVYSQADIFVNWDSGISDLHLKNCNAYIKEESDNIRKGLKKK